jgi:hypothetical protein
MCAAITLAPLETFQSSHGATLSIRHPGTAMDNPIVSKPIDAILAITARAWQIAPHEAKPSRHSASQRPMNLERPRNAMPQLARSMLDFEKTHHEA